MICLYLELHSQRIMVISPSYQIIPIKSVIIKGLRWEASDIILIRMLTGHVSHQPAGIKQIFARFVIKVTTHILELYIHTWFGLWNFEVWMSMLYSSVASIYAIQCWWGLDKCVQYNYESSRDTLNSEILPPHVAYKQKNITVSLMSLQILP